MAAYGTGSNATTACIGVSSAQEPESIKQQHVGTMWQGWPACTCAADNGVAFRHSRYGDLHSVKEKCAVRIITIAYPPPTKPKWWTSKNVQGICTMMAPTAASTKTKWTNNGTTGVANSSTVSGCCCYGQSGFAAMDKVALLLWTKELAQSEIAGCSATACQLRNRQQPAAV